MPRLRIIAVVALAISLLAAVACRSQSEPPLALLQAVVGSAEVFSGPQSSLTIVSEEIELKAGDRIRVPDQSRAVVIFFEGSAMLLDGGSDVTLEEVAGRREVGSSSISIYQSVGRTVHRVVKLVDAESSYGVRTSNSVGGVRGTGFVVEQHPVTGARWKSFEGTIGVAGASGVETLVETGTVTEVPPAADPSPPVDEPLTADEQALVDAIDEVIEARDLPAPPAKDPEQSTPIAAPTPTLVPVEEPAPQAALAELPPPVTPSSADTSAASTVAPTATLAATPTSAPASATPTQTLSPSPTPSPSPAAAATSATRTATSPTATSAPTPVSTPTQAPTQPTASPTLRATTSPTPTATATTAAPTPTVTPEPKSSPTPSSAVAATATPATPTATSVTIQTPAATTTPTPSPSPAATAEPVLSLSVGTSLDDCCVVISAGADARQFPPLKIVRFVVEVDGQSVFDTGAIEDDEITGTVTACFEVSGSHIATIKVWDDGLHATDPVTKSQAFEVECGAAFVQTPSTATPAPTATPASVPTDTPTPPETPVATETPPATPTAAPTDTPPPSASIIHIAGITTSFQHFSGNSDAIYFVTIQDQNGVAVAGVLVDGQVSGPLGTFPVSAVSTANGVAELRHNTTSFGTYTLNVTSVLGAGMTYDGDATVTLSASVTLQ